MIGRALTVAVWIMTYSKMVKKPGGDNMIGNEYICPVCGRLLTWIEYIECGAYEQCTCFKEYVMNYVLCSDGFANVDDRITSPEPSGDTALYQSGYERGLDVGYERGFNHARQKLQDYAFDNCYRFPRDIFR